MSDIRNTTAAMTDPVEAERFLLEDMEGGPNAPVEAQEAAGQREMLTAAALPTRTMYCTDRDLIDLGFTLGDPRPDDPLFRDATFPEGWTRVPFPDSDYGTYVVDRLGRPRVLLWYKSAFYDRRAHIKVLDVHSYAEYCVDRRTPPVLDQEWATRERMLAALDDIAVRQTESRASFADDPDLLAVNQEWADAIAWVRDQLP